MDRVSVTSSNLASVGYDPETLTLEIEFHSGSVYQYFKVPLALHSRLMAARSLGRFFHKHIEDRYQYKRVA